MIIRAYIRSDEDQIQELAKKHNISVPDYGEILVAETDDGKIIGFINLRTVVMIEPLISENPLATNKLFDEAMLRLKIKKAPIVRAFVKKGNKNLADRVGFNEVFCDEIIIEKIIEPLTDQEIFRLREKSFVKNKNIN
jgi:hypothetical protein